MERESFENLSSADVLNKFFICIKVDKEERADIDHIYMNVCQMLTGSGGWPLSIFMTSEQEPFYAGTYFPDSARYGIPSFRELLFSISDLWEKDREKIMTAASEIVTSTTCRSSNMIQGAVDKVKHKAAHNAISAYAKQFDREHGGLGDAPKFPSPHHIFYLLRYYAAEHDIKALQMAEKNLNAMYEGGVYDHIGFGFCRYSTDRKWLVPHFEKMLYDNALLCIAYTEGYQVTGKEHYRRAACEILEFVEREMISPEGGFYTAIDADSEGEEGKYYLWSRDEVCRILGSGDGEAFCNAFDISDEGNFEGKNIPHQIGKSLAGMYPQREKLLTEREKRQKPYKDDKILTGQNGMMIAAASIAGRVFDETRFINIAENAVSFIINHLINKDGRLLARYRDGSAGILAYADDYAYLIWGLLELYSVTLSEEYLQCALSLNSDMIDLFEDKEAGGLFLYGHDGEKLISRPKDFYDGAIPSANSVALHNYIKLAALTGDETLKQKARSIPCPDYIENLSAIHHVSGLMHLENDTQVRIAGDITTDGYENMLTALRHSFLPFTTVLPVCSQAGDKGAATAYVCSGFSCLPPVNSVEELLNTILNSRQPAVAPLL